MGLLHSMIPSHPNPEHAHVNCAESAYEHSTQLQGSLPLEMDNDTTDDTRHELNEFVSPIRYINSSLDSITEGNLYLVMDDEDDELQFPGADFKFAHKVSDGSSPWHYWHYSMEVPEIPGDWKCINGSSS